MANNQSPGGLPVVQMQAHSGTLRAMPESRFKKTIRPEVMPAAETAGSVPSEPTLVEPDEQNEIGGPAGPEPTRYGDWERKGRCIDF